MMRIPWYSTTPKAWRISLMMAIAVPLTIVMGRWACGGFDMTYFILAGEDVVLENRVKYPIKIVDGRGYDGLTYYQLALDPTNTDPHAFGLMSNIAYRKQRILYPITSYLFSFGQPEWVPYSMILVNLLAILLAVYLIYGQLNENDSYPIYLILTTGLVGLYIALTRNLAESMEAFFLVILFGAVIKDRSWALFLACFGVLFTRETSALIVGSLGLATLVSMVQEKKIKIIRLLTLAIPLLSVIYWKYYLYQTLGGHRVGDVQLVPFSGFYETYLRFSEQLDNSAAAEKFMILGYQGFCVIFLAWIFGTLILVLKRIKWREHKIGLWVGISVIIWLTFALLLNHSIYRSDLSFGRVFNGILILSLLYMGYSKQKLPTRFLLFTFGLYFVGYIRLIFIT